MEDKRIIKERRNCKMKQKEIKKIDNKGITLIALVITIIVLLILAGVSIAMLTGENGILTQAQRAANETEQAALEEKIKLLSAEAMINEQTGNVEEKTAKELQDELKEQGENVLVAQWDKYIIFDLNENKEYRVTSNGEVEYYGESTMGNILKNTKTPNSEQVESRNNGYIGVGTDGSTVNLDLWEYTINSKGCTLNNNEEDEKGTSIIDLSGSCGYSVGESENNIVNGKIKGCVPAFIRTNEGESWIAVTSMFATFYNIKSLTTPPEIPNTVISLRETFLFCENLISMPEIPNDVVIMRSTFNGCSNLVNVINIPNKVRDMGSTFQNCILLENFGDIPNSVNRLSYTFYNCKNLKKVGYIGDGVKDMSFAFADCSKLIGISNIPQNVENLNTAFSSCTNLKDIDIVIPETANDITGIFGGCINLQGRIQINANPENYEYCFHSGCATNGSGLTITGTSDILQELNDEYGSNGKIKFE